MWAKGYGNVVQLKLLNGQQAGMDFLTRHFPVTIGRSSANDLRLREAGIWDRHLEIHLEAPHTFALSTHQSSFATINDLPVRQASLRHGDVIGLGPLKLLFTLSPTVQRSLRWREWLVWIGFGLLCLGQIALVYWLPG